MVYNITGLSIPKQTLSDRLTGNVDLIAKLGRPTALTTTEENEMVEMCILFAEWGFWMGKNEVLRMVSDYCSNTKQHNLFHKGTPSSDWWKGSLKQHPQLIRRKPQPLQLVRARASRREVVKHYFKQVLKPVLDKYQPSQIYNPDETGIYLSGGPTTILAKRGSKALQRIIGGTGRENITVHVCFSASGTYIPLYIVYSGKRLMLSHTQGGQIGARYGVSPSG